MGPIKGCQQARPLSLAVAWRRSSVVRTLSEKWEEKLSFPEVTKNVGLSFSQMTIIATGKDDSESSRYFPDLVSEGNAIRSLPWIKKWKAASRNQELFVLGATPELSHQGAPEV